MKLLKKILSVVCLACLLTVNACALRPNQLTISDEFFVYSNDPAAVAQTLDMDQTQLEAEIKNSGTILLAVNQNNTKQIRLTVDETEFSAAAGNFATLSDTAIKSLLPDITGLENVQGKIVKDNNGEKYVKIALQNQKGEYLLTQFFTVTDHKIYTLSFYTNIGESTDYIDTTFPTVEVTSENQSISAKTTAGSEHKLIRIAVVCAMLIFGGIFFFLLVTLLKDFFRPKKSDGQNTD